MIQAEHRAWIRRLMSSGPHRRRHALWWSGTFETRKWCESCGFRGIVYGPADHHSRGYHDSHYRSCTLYRRPSSRSVEPTLGLVRSAGGELADYLAWGRVPTRIRAEQGLQTGRWHLHALSMPASHSDVVSVDRGLTMHARDYGFHLLRHLRGPDAELAYLEKHETRLAKANRALWWPTWLVQRTGQILEGV